MNERRKLLKRLQICDFAIQEVVLYLDTHPNNKKALEFYNKNKEMRKEILEEFERKFGPMTNNANNSETFNWIDNPWPWEEI